MEKVTFCGKELNLTNREAKLVRIINQSAGDVLRYFHENSFEDKTMSVCRMILQEQIDGLVSAFYFMDRFDDPVSWSDVELIRNDKEFMDAILGDGWEKQFS